nr:MAG TPA: hypothetical protein [Caudoviricetes sp.]
MIFYRFPVSRPAARSRRASGFLAFCQIHLAKLI